MTYYGFKVTEAGRDAGLKNLWKMRTFNVIEDDEPASMTVYIQITEDGYPDVFAVTEHWTYKNIFHPEQRETCKEVRAFVCRELADLLAKEYVIPNKVNCPEGTREGALGYKDAFPPGYDPEDF